ncbi:MAG: mechanosensitive ion channel domain-containing protein, partial [Planctomycetota bacterium]
WIRSPDRNIEGTVEHIGWRLTRIRTFDKRPLYIPNGLFSTISIENPSRMQNRRIKQTIGVRYEDAPKIEMILKQIEEMLKVHPEIDQTKITFVNLVNFAPYSLEFLLHTFTKTTNRVKFQQVQQDILLKVLEIIEKSGAQCAFPTTTVNLPPEGKPIFSNKKLNISKSVEINPS